MADLSQNSSNVLVNNPSQTQDGTAGEAINAGMPVYLNNSAWYQAKANGNSVQSGLNGLAIAINTALAANQPVKLWVNGYLNTGATTVKGTAYAVSNNTGKICPLSDISTNSYPTVLGIAMSTNGQIQSPGAALFAPGVTV